jgi:DNA repair protein RecO (recombination protein O)
MIVKTEAIVLRSRKYRETSKILNLYTKEFGKISVIAKGARGPKNKFGSSLQPLNHVNAVLYKHERDGLHLLSQCENVSSLRKLSEDLEKFSAAMSVVELLEFVSHGEERSERLFGLALEALETINDAEGNATNVQFHFQLHLADILGFKPNIHSCISCGRVLDEESVGTKGGELRLEYGGVSCSNCFLGAEGSRKMSLATLKILQRFQEHDDASDLIRIRLLEHQTEELGTFLKTYLESHVGGLHRMKVRHVAASIM